jgi:hypothetical protein
MERVGMNFKERLEAYRKTYDIDDIVNPNDLANLHILINNQELIDVLQDEVSRQLSGSNDITQAIQNIQRIQDARAKLVEQNLTIEKTLGIDRKTRKKDTQEDAGNYIVFLKTAAQEFLERQYITVYCDKCKIMVGRAIPVHDHTEFDIRFQCSQCNKMIQVKRKERDVFFDIKGRNKEWRKKYPIEVIQGKEETIESDDDVYVGDEDDPIETG